ncbi:hypothetical protein HDE_11626 [Halotydeus destructor]|nr:hypothetical protein HDE_11626 [Halotydeus destructor]
MNSRDHSIYASLDLISYTLSTCLVFFTLTYVSSVNKREYDENVEISNNWWFNSVQVKNAELASSFKQLFSQVTPLTAILFELDVRFMLGYVGSIITFTVMFVQLNGCQMSSE